MAKKINHRGHREHRGALLFFSVPPVVFRTIPEDNKKSRNVAITIQNISSNIESHYLNEWMYVTVPRKFYCVISATAMGSNSLMFPAMFSAAKLLICAGNDHNYPCATCGFIHDNEFEIV